MGLAPAVPSPATRGMRAVWLKSRITLKITVRRIVAIAVCRLLKMRQAQ